MPQIGPYSLYAIETGRFGLDGGAMFGIIPKPLWERRIQPDEQNRIRMAMRCLLLVGNNRVILIDNGLGDKYDEKFARIYAVDHEHSELHRSLHAVGLSADDVTDVLLTHLHFDHGGGSTRRAGDRLKLTFPNALHHVQQTHWEWAAASNPREKASFLDENLDPLAASGQLQLINGSGPWIDGIELITVDGHTRAQQLVKISDADRTLVFVADLIPTVAHIPPVWGMSYDLDPLKTIEEKETFLEEACSNGWHLFFEHDASVAVADLEQSERGIRATHLRSLEEL